MAQLTIIYWRDIPAQVVVKAGRKTAKRQLADRFQEAVDRAAMGAGLTGSDAYLTEWRRGDPAPCGDDLEAEAQNAADALDADYPQDRIRALVKNNGREGSPE